MARLQIEVFHSRRSAADTCLQLAIAACLCLALLQCKDKPGKPGPAIRTIYYTPAWSPDGTEIASVVERIGDSGARSAFIVILDAVTGQIRRERPLDFPPPFDLNWTPDGAWILFGAGPGIFKLSADLVSLIQLTSGQFQTEPSVSRARNLVFFTEDNGAKGGLFSVTLGGDSLQLWSTPTTIVLGCTAYSDSSDSLVGFDASRIPYPLIVFAPESIAAAHSLPAQSGRTIARITRDRHYIAYNHPAGPTEECPLVLLDRADNSTRCVTTSITEGMAFSPDGAHLVYPILGGEKVGLWVLDIPTGSQRQLTDGRSST